MVLYNLLSLACFDKEILFQKKKYHKKEKSHQFPLEEYAVN